VYSRSMTWGDDDDDDDADDLVDNDRNPPDLAGDDDDDKDTWTGIDSGTHSNGNSSSSKGSVNVAYSRKVQCTRVMSRASSYLIKQAPRTTDR
jgi:hypothetical protein